MAKKLMTDEFETKFLSELTRKSMPFLRSGERFVVGDHSIEEGAWSLTVTFHNTDRSLFLPVELGVVASENPRLNNDEARDVMVDFVDYFFERYFRDAREVTLPIDWGTVPFGEFTLRARGWEKNLRLEELADRLLAGEPIDHLVAPRGERLAPR